LDYSTLFPTNNYDLTFLRSWYIKAERFIKTKVLPYISRRTNDGDFFIFLSVANSINLLALKWLNSSSDK